MKIDIPLPKGGTFQQPSRIIVHAMAQFVDDGKKVSFAADFLREIGISAHILVCPDGTIIQCRQDNQGAYHAKGHNGGTLGIEFLVRGVHDYGSLIETIKTPYISGPQYQAGKQMCLAWTAIHGIGTLQRHSDVDPKRKSDPGEGFPWNKFKREVLG
jgi:N-acetyl-anhydromuramyl-L-alanine amidase AmpD